MRLLHKAAGEFRIEAGQPDGEARLQEVGLFGGAEIDFHIDGEIRRQCELTLAGSDAMAPMKQADQPAANSCSGLVPAPVLPGGDRRMSTRPSVLRAMPRGLR
ncbi:hypothetical protein J2X65_005403 [Ancylobacter sp. 3268]|nr:hypothetical protein [Ancylobacter sp. 3268]